MKRISALIAVLGMILAGLIITAPAAGAVDHRRCVTRGEFRAVHRPMTQAQVRNVFDVSGYEIGRSSYWIYDGYYDSYWQEDNYWAYYDYDGDGITDETVLVDSGYWVDEWVDTSYRMIDTFKTYKKCRDRNFDRGRGRVAINFDNYSSSYSGMRIYAKYRNNPWYWMARVVLPEKDRPENKTPENTPAPHGHLKDTVVKP